MRKLTATFLTLFLLASPVNTYAANEENVNTAIVENTEDESISLANLTPEEQKTLESSKKDMVIEFKNNFKLIPIRNSKLSNKTKLVLYCTCSLILGVAAACLVHKLTVSG